MNANKLSLLVVDDDAFQRQFITSMLSAMGAVTVYAAENGRQALDLIQAEDGKSIDVVLCDLSMPEMDGLEFLRLLGEKNRNVAIVIISALGSKLLLSAGNMAKMYGLNLLGVTEKPIAMHRIKDMFDRYDLNLDEEGQQKDDQTVFSLDEILAGIRARQFEPFFQPNVNLQTGALAGAEALARWQHPERGLVGPSAFIPQLEQSGAIDELTFLMLEKAVSACRLFHDQGFPISISVNLSQVSLNDTRIAEKITRIVRDIGLDPKYIVLEVTESAAMTDVAYALETLMRLCMNGFVLSIDDYGTGYSTLQQLMRIPFSELKIDKSFVKGFADHEVQLIVVESSIDIARKLQVRSLAEGVESQQEWDMLKTMGCDTAQGYFIARPMDTAAFTDFCARGASAGDG